MNTTLKLRISDNRQAAIVQIRDNDSLPMEKKALPKLIRITKITLK